MTIIKVRVGLQGNRGLTGLAAPASITVANNIVNVNLVGDSIVDVNTVADSIVDVNTVADSIVDVNTVADSIVDVNTVADNISNVIFVADNITDIVAASNAAAAATFYYGATGGSSNAFTLTTGNSVIPSAGKAFRFISNRLTTGNITLAVDGESPRSVLIDGITQVPKYGIKNGQVVTVLDDGTNYQILHNGESTGDLLWWASSTPKAGYLWCDGVTTLGKSGSGATVAQSYIEGLYCYFWDSVSNTKAPVSSGRGANAQADFAAGKTLTMPTSKDLSPYGIGSTITQAFNTSGAATVTSTGSVTVNMASTTLSASNLPALNYTISLFGSDGGATGLYIANCNGSNSTNATATGAVATNAGGSAFTPSVSSSPYTGNATSVVHPVLGLYLIVKI